MELARGSSSGSSESSPAEENCIMDASLWSRLLHEHLLEIIVRMPTASKARLRAVCKCWDSMWSCRSRNNILEISQARLKTEVDNEYWFEYNSGVFSMGDDPNWSFYKPVNNKSFMNGFSSFIWKLSIRHVRASAGGLMLCDTTMKSKDGCQMIVCNPLRADCGTALPRSKFADWVDPTFGLIGLAADEETKSFKVVIGSYFEKETEIYDSVSESWKLILACGPVLKVLDPSFTFIEQLHSFNGDFLLSGRHFLYYYGYGEKITVFDLEMERWIYLSLPPSAPPWLFNNDHNILSGRQLHVHEGQLYMFEQYDIFPSIRASFNIYRFLLQPGQDLEFGTWQLEMRCGRPGMRSEFVAWQLEMNYKSTVALKTDTYIALRSYMFHRWCQLLHVYDPSEYDDHGPLKFTTLSPMIFRPRLEACACRKDRKTYN